jgi:hypothetical protein
MQTYYIIDPHRGAKFQLQKEVLGPKMPCRTKNSSSNEHLMMHLFMAHGVDPLVGEAVNSVHFLISH